MEQVKRRPKRSVLGILWSVDGSVFGKHTKGFLVYKKWTVELVSFTSYLVHTEYTERQCHLSMDSNDNEEINESINHRIRQANGDPNAINDMNAQNDKSQAVLDSFTELKETTTTYTIFKSPVRSINISEPSTPSVLGNVIKDKEDSLREIRDGSVEKEEANEHDNNMNGESDLGIDTDDEEEVQEHDYDDDELVSKRILIQLSLIHI